MDPRQQALRRLDTLLGRASLDPSQCMQLVELVTLAPGRLRAVAEALAAQRTSGAMQALLELPANVPGVVEGMFQALGHGVARLRLDGSPCAHLLAMDFNRSRARGFEQLMARAHHAFGPGFEHLQVGARTCYRVSVVEGRGTFAGRVAATAHDILHLHGRLSRLKGTRLWLNGWCFEGPKPIGAGIQVHLVRAWLGWAASQTRTQI